MDHQKVNEYFQKLSETAPKVQYLNTYFDKKALILHEIIKKFSSISDDIERDFQSALDENFFVTEDEKIATLNFYKGYDLWWIDAFNEMLQDDYKPTTENLLSAMRHLSALYRICSQYKPENMAADTLLRLDVATLKLVCLLSGVVEKIPFDVQRYRQKFRSKRAKTEKQSVPTNRKIIEAYQSLSPIWPNGDAKRPITLNKNTPDEMKLSLHKFAGEIQTAIKTKHPKDAPTEKWIVTCLKNLRKDGNL